VVVHSIALVPKIIDQRGELIGAIGLFSAKYERFRDARDASTPLCSR